MLAITLKKARPNPEVEGDVGDIWYDFGFCTCRDDFEENFLGMLYQSLLPHSDQDQQRSRERTFEEFWKAYETGKLTKPMDSKGLKSRRQKLKHLQVFLNAAGPSGLRPSVWRLIRYINYSDPANITCPQSVFADYGFMKCHSTSQTLALVDVYRRLLKQADPLDLHDACLKGSLYEFATRYISVEDKYKSLMKNFYPL